MTSSLPDAVLPLPPDKLYTPCDTAQFGFNTNAELEDFSEFIGQPRAAGHLEGSQVAVRFQNLPASNTQAIQKAAVGNHAAALWHGTDGR